MAACNLCSPVECPLCLYLSPTLSLYVSHLRLVHSKDDAFHITCGIDGCTEIFGAFAALNSHIYRHHRVALGLERRAPESSTDEQTGDTDLEAEINETDPASSDLSTPGAPLDASTPSGSMDISAAKFLLHMREGRQISQIAIGDIISGCNRLCNEALKEFQAKIKRDLVNMGIDYSPLPSLTEGVDVDLFEKVKNNYLFEKYCTEHFGCLVSTLV